jgi:hypothetical protein
LVPELVPAWVPDKLEPVTVPTAATLSGVISPRLRLKVPDEVIGPPVTPIPSEGVIATDVTVPDPDIVVQDKIPEPFVVSACPDDPDVVGQRDEFRIRYCPPPAAGLM